MTSADTASGRGEVHYTVRDQPGEVFDLPLGTYPDGMPLVNWTDGVVPDHVLLRPRSLATLLGTLFWVDGLRERCVPVPHLILPNLPGARQDRLNPTGDYLFTAKSFAQMINAREFPSVTVLDPHSTVMPGMINRCNVVSPATAAAFLIGKGVAWSHVVAPDGGAEHRAQEWAAALHRPLAHGWKRRSVTDGSLTGFGVEKIFRRSHVLVVDDLCDGGGTFVGLAKQLAVREITADLFVTHGLFTKGLDVLTPHFRRIYTTDSEVRYNLGILSNPALTILPICRQLLGLSTEGWTP